MADNVGRLSVHVVARTDRFRSGMGRARKTVNRFTVSTRHAQSAVRGLLIGMGGLTTMGGISTMVGVGGITYGMIRFAGAVEKLNQSMHSSLAIMGDVSATMRKKMMATVMDVAAVTRYSADDIAKSYFYLASAGLNVQQSIKALPQVAKFAQAGMFDMARATDLLTDAQSALGLTVKDSSKNMENMKKVSDALVKANTLANASVEQFSTSLTTKAGAALRIVNKDIEEGLAVLAVFADQGVKGAEAGTALAIVMRDLQTKAVKSEEAFKKMGVAVFDDMGRMQNLAAIIRDLENAMSGMLDFAKKKMVLDLGFSDKSVNFLLTLIGKSRQIERYERDLREAKGITDEVAGKQMTEWMKSWNLISASLIRFGEDYVLPLVNALAKMIKPPDPRGKGVGGLGLPKRTGVGLHALANEIRASTLKLLYRGSTKEEILRSKYNLSWHQQNELEDKGTFHGKPVSDFISDAELGYHRALKERMANFERLADYQWSVAKGVIDPIKVQAQKDDMIARRKKADKEFIESVNKTINKWFKLSDQLGLDVDHLRQIRSGIYGPFDPRTSPKALAKRQVAEEKQEKAAKTLKKAADTLKLRLRTPMQIFADSENQLREMLSAGFITQGIFEQARKVSLQESFGGGGDGLNPAIERGTQQQFIVEARERANQRRQEILKQMLIENDKQTRLLRDIEANTSNDPSLEDAGI